MPSYQYPRSLVAQFSEELYKNAGASDVLPLLMRCLDPYKVQAVQFLRAGKVRLTFQDSEILKDGLDLGDVSVQLSPADERLRTIHLRDLPIEIDQDVVSGFFAEFGEVLSVDHCFFNDYPATRNGNRMARVLLDRDIPHFVEIDGCSCRVWYSRQPAQCTICRQSGHRAPACPLSVRCRQPGHVARECTQAWGSPSPVLTTLVPPDHAMETEDATSSSSAVPDPLPDPVISTAYVSTVITTSSAITASAPSSFSSPVMATSASVASESDLPTSVSPAPVTTTSSAPTSDPSTSVSTASSSPVCTPSLSFSASSRTSPAPVSSKKDDQYPCPFPESVTDQTTARAYLN